MKCCAETVARAIVKASMLAGRSCGVCAVEDETEDQRVANLLKSRHYHGHDYGPYIVDGDPNEWGGGGAVVTIYMEPIGTPDDCYLPLDYWGGGHAVAMAASELLPGSHYIEFVNAAVACVYPA